MADMRPGAEQTPTPERLQGAAGGRLKAAIAGAVVVGIVAFGLVSGGAFGGGGDRSASAAASAQAEASNGGDSALGEASGPPSASATPEPSGAPTPSPFPYVAVDPTSPGLIAVVSDDGQLSTMDDGGGSRSVYLTPGVTFGFPAWSPDGSRIAITGQSADGTAIYVYAVGRRSQPTVIYRSADKPPFYLYWTPDGQSVAFLATEGSSIALRVAPADGSAPLDGSADGSVLQIGAPLYFDWVDSKRLLVHVGLGAQAFAGEVGPDGVPVQQALPATGTFRSPSVSHDRRYLAYVRSDSDLTGTLVIAARNGSAKHEVPVFGPTAFTFDPTGDRLAAIAAVKTPSPDTGVPLGPLKLIDAPTGATRTLIDSAVVASFWSPDGKTIAAILPPRPGDDNVLADAGPGSGISLAEATAPRPTGLLAMVLAPQPTLGPAAAAPAPGVAARLEFVDVATGKIRFERVIHLADHFVNELLPYFDQYALSHSLWSPDSRSILLPLVSAAGRDQLTVVPADGWDDRAIADGDSGFWSP